MPAKMRAMPARVKIVVAVVSGPARANAEDISWQPVVSEDGIEVTEREVPGRDLPTFRGVGEVQGGLYEVLAVVTDVSRHTEWMHDCMDARLLERMNERVIVFYNRIDTAWPVADRDIVLRGEIVAADAEY